MGNVFDTIDGDNALNAAGFWKFNESMQAMQDEIAGGHWNVNQDAHAAVTNHVISIFGTDGKMTKEQFYASFPVFMSKIKESIKEYSKTTHKLQKCQV